MGKIKGWKKIRDNSKNVEWRQQAGYYPKTGRPQSVEIIIRRNKPVILYYGVYDTTFKTPKEARTFAIKWMKKHPKG